MGEVVPQIFQFFFRFKVSAKQNQKLNQKKSEKQSEKQRDLQRYLVYQHGLNIVIEFKTVHCKKKNEKNHKLMCMCVHVHVLGLTAF